MDVENENGQALFEFLLFIPILFLCYSLINHLGNAINGSINQQKAARGYFFFLAAGNSYVPDNGDIRAWKSSGLKNVGMSYVGWKYKTVNQGSYGSCFQGNEFFNFNEEEECDKPEIVENKTNFVRVYTAFGVCGETYLLNSNEVFERNPIAKLSRGCILE